MGGEEDGALKGFKGELSHEFSKHDGALKNTDYFGQVKAATTQFCRRRPRRGEDGRRSGQCGRRSGQCLLVPETGYLNGRGDELSEKDVDSRDTVLVKGASFFQKIPNKRASTRPLSGGCDTYRTPICPSRCETHLRYSLTRDVLLDITECFQTCRIHPLEASCSPPLSTHPSTILPF